MRVGREGDGARGDELGASMGRPVEQWGGQWQATDLVIETHG